MRVGGNSLLGTVLAVAACGGGGAASQPAPVPSAEAAVRSFFQAVADSNIARMATLWGTEKGSAASTGQPPDYEKRLGDPDLSPERPLQIGERATG